MKIDEPALATVGDGVGAEDRSVDLGHGVEDGAHPLPLAAAVGEEEAAVLAGERTAHAVLEEARRAHDQWRVTQLVENHRHALDDLGREARVLEELDDVGKLLPNLRSLPVLLLQHLVEIVVLDEAHLPFGGDVPASWNLDLADRSIGRSLTPQNCGGEKEPGAFAAELAVAGIGVDDAIDEVEEIVGLDVLLGNGDEFELVGEKAPDQTNVDSVESGRRKLGAVGEQVVEPAEGAGDLGQARARVVEHRRQEARLVLHHPVPGQGEGGVGTEIVIRQIEGLALEQRLLVEGTRSGRVVGIVSLVFIGRTVDGLQELFPSIDSRPHQVVDHLAGDAEV